MANCKPRSTSCEMDIKKTSDKINFIDSKTYHEIIGRLIYIMVATRPDMSYTVTRPRKTKFLPFNKSKVCLMLFKKHNQSVTHI